MVLPSPYLTDGQIQALLAEPKALPANWRSKAKPKEKRGHTESEYSFVGSAGSEFKIILRQSVIIPIDFSAILAYSPPGSSTTFRLRRYNGKSHLHANKLEGGTPFYDYHIHIATERYQRRGFDEDAYAERTNRYTSLDEGLACLIADCTITIGDGSQKTLFHFPELMGEGSGGTP